MFPLTILPLPGELVPLHIFEARYRQLLEDAELHAISFGIFFNHTMNNSNVGSLVKLESIIKKYPTGESDIIVKCVDLFTLDTLYKIHNSKLYPAGLVEMWGVDADKAASLVLVDEYIHYLDLQKNKNHIKRFSTYQIANELGLDFEDRLKFISYNEEKKEIFLLARIKYQKHLLLEAEKAKDVFHLN
jgi:Lon protease-like protein